MNFSAARTALAAVLTLALLAGGYAAFDRSRTWREERATTGTDSSPAAKVAPDLAAPPALASKGGRATSTIVGTVRRDGEPATARVVARRAPDESTIDADNARLAPTQRAGTVVADVQVGTDGKFEFAKLSPGKYVLDAVGDDGARGRTTIDSLAADVRRSTTITLESGRETLHGRVLLRDGRPWRGRVRVLLDGAGQPPYDDENPFVRWATTDDAGRFEAPGLSGERVAAQAVEEGAACVEGPRARLPYRGDYVLVVPTEAEGVSGLVVADDGGAPIPGAVVRAWDTGVRSVFRRATGEDGRFRIPFPSPRSWVGVSAAGFSGDSDWFDRSDPNVVFHLVRTGTLRGRVTTDGDGRAAGGIGVYVAGGRGGQPAWRATTDADGVYEVTGLGAGEFAVYARGRGWNVKGLERTQNAGWNPYFVTLEPGRSVVADLVVVPGARATGHVRTVDGRPVAGARVSATPSVPYGDGVAALGALFGGETATTSDDGAFSLTTLVGGVEYAFEVHADGFPPKLAGSRVANATTAIDLDVRLVTPRFIDVRVVETGTKQPIAGAVVGLKGGHERERYEAAWVTADDGTARVGPVEADTYTVGAEATDRPHGGSSASTVTVTDIDVTVTIELAPDPAFEIEGRVLLPDGTPAAGAGVSCNGYGELVEVETEFCDGEGRFRFERLGSGDQTLNAVLTSAERSFSAYKTVMAGQRDVVLMLAALPIRDAAPNASGARPGRSVSVVDAAGLPVPRATLYILDAGSLRYLSWRQVTDGRALIDADLTNRDRTLEVKSATTAGGTPLPLGVGWGDMPVGTNPVEVRLPSETPIEGTVLGPDGQPIAGVLLEAMPARLPEPDPRRRAEQIVSHARTDAAGTFRIGRVGPEPCRIYVYTPPGCALPEPVTADGGTRGLAIRLHRGVSPTVTVLDAEGHPVVGALVSASLGPHETYLEWSDSIVTVLNEGGIARTSATGVVNLPALDPDRTYDLYVGIPQNRADILGLDTPAWKPADTTIRLPRTYTVRGVVRDTEGAVVSGALVTCTLDGRNIGTANSTAAGAFEIGKLPAGRLEVHASPPGRSEGGDPETATANVEAGATGIALVVQATVELLVRVEDWVQAEGTGGYDREAVLTREPITDDSPAHSLQPSDHGTLRFRGLTPGATYTLWISPGRDGRIVYARGLKGGGPEIVVHLEPGEAIRGKVTVPPESKRVLVHATGSGYSVWANVGADGRYEFPGLPHGPCRLTASAQFSDDDLESSVDAKAGQTVDFELKPK